jgi:hypothetical protein
MIRAVIGACVGGCCGVVALAALGGVYGYLDGWNRIPPGLDAAWTGAFVAAAYFWWLAFALGAVIGGLAGLGSALVGQWIHRKRASRAV